MERVRLEDEWRERLAALRGKYVQKQGAQVRAIARHLRELKAWCELHHVTRTKRYRLPAGTLSWRPDPFGTGEQLVVRPAQTRREEFLREKPSG